eukprot:Skav211367  [mRNA]  locus=scaffold1816:54940:56446:+ [translate_table: standard]
MRQPVSEPLSIGIEMVRLQKRMLHLCAQRVEMALGNGMVRLTSVAAALKTGDASDLEQWSAGKTRTQAADLLRQELIRRFLAKPCGFVTGFKNADQAELQDVPGGKNHASGMQAASQFCTAYFACASEMLMSKLSKQTFRHVAFFFDAATVGKLNVMSIHVATDGVVCAAPCSLLPQLKQPGEKEPEELLLAIQDVNPSVPLHELTQQDPSAKEMKLCEKAKATTRTKLLALNQSLNHLINLRLCDSEPVIKLRAQTRSEVRKHHIDETGIPRAYLWCNTTKNCTWQCTMPKEVDKTVRLSSLTDEGETGCALVICNAGLAVMVHRDVQHKLHREEVLAMGDVDEVHLAMKETMLVLKSEFAPWGSGMFGRRMKETLKFVEMIPVPHVLLELCGPGIIEDLQLAPDLSQHDIKQVLVDYARKGGEHRTAGSHKLGRWWDWGYNFPVV